MALAGLSRFQDSSSGSKGSFLSGGFFSDVIDVLSVPYYGLSGAVDSQKTFLEGIKTRTTMSEVLGVENPFAAFAVDVLLDPLTYTGIGGLTKVKGASALAKGTLASTLAMQGIKGERALLTLGGHTLIQGKGVFKGITQTTEQLKQLSPHVSSAIEKLGGRGALTSISGTNRSIAQIEFAAKQLDAVRQADKFAKRGADFAIGKYRTITSKVNKDVAKITKQLGLDLNETAAKFTAKAYDDSVAIAPELQESFDKLMGITKELDIAAAKVIDNTIANYKVPSVLTDEIALKAQGFARREIPGKTSKEKLRTYTGFVNEGGPAIGGKITGAKSAMLTDGTVLEKIGDAYYSADRMSDFRKAAEAAKKEVLKKQGEKSVLAREASSVGKSISSTKKQLSKLAGKTDEDSTIARSKLKKDLELFTVKQKSLQDSLERVNTAIGDSRKIDSFDKLFDAYSKGSTHAKEAFKVTDISVDMRNSTYKHFTGRDAAFNRDFSKLIDVRAQTVAQAGARKNFTDFAKSIGRKVDGDVPAGMARSNIDELKGYAFPEEIVGHMDATYVRYQDFQEIGKFFEAFDKSQNLLKGVLTYTNLAFHTRNVISNLWNMSYAMNPAAAMKAYAGSFDLQRRVMKGAKGGDAFALLSKAERADVKEAMRLGIINTGAFTMDLEGLLAKAQDSALFKPGKYLGTLLEDSGKLGMYRYMKNTKGYTSKAAADEVFKYLFDYGDLTNFERNTLKRALPFYTWSRKNIPLQVAMLIQQPGKFTRIGHFRNAVEGWADGKPMDEKYMPEWLKEAMPIYFGTGADGLQKFIKLEGFIPAVDLNLLSRPHEAIFEQLTPLIKTPAEIVMNYDTFLEMQMSSYPGQKERFMGMYFSPATEKVLSTIRPLNEVNKLLGLGDIKEIPEWQDRVMNFILGKSYDLSLQKQRSTFQYLQMLQEGMINKDMDQARSKGDTGEVTRLQGLLQSTRRGEDITL